jgi:hypothetical protein
VQYNANIKRHACGVVTCWTTISSPEEAVAEIAKSMGRDPLGQLLVFFSSHYEPESLAAAFLRCFHGIPFAGCTTSGEITPAGFSNNGLLVVGFPKAGFGFVSGIIPDIHHLNIERGAEIVGNLRAKLDRLSVTGSANRFALSFIDGLSRCEEVVVSAIHWALGDIPLVGGSAGDNLALKRTTLLHNGQVHRNAAVLLLAETSNPIRVFNHDHFDPTDTKLVVTEADAETRTVFELNAEPAALEYANSVGIEPSSLAPMSFAAHPVVVRVGGNYYCRSIQRLNPDGSLTFFCAIDNGVVLTVAESRDMVASAAAQLETLNDMVGGLDLVIAFECVLRRLEAENRQVKHLVADLYRRYNVVGFNTYGEQYNSMHVNQTFTGIGIGHQEML